MSSITGLGIRDRAKAKMGKGDAPKSSAPKESSSITGLGIRDRATGLIGKGKGANAEEHSTRPLHTLKDPSAFGPPPRHVNAGGGRREGLGAPLTREEIEDSRRREEEEAYREEERNTKPPSVPYRVDTTGLSTSHLPPPPKYRDGPGSRDSPAVPGNRPKAPGLPPRLPPRQNSSPMPSPTIREAPREPDSHRAILNQGALNNLSSAGISVPGFGIGGGSASSGRQVLPPPAPPPRTQSPATSLSNTPANNSPVNELQSRFARLSKEPKEAPSAGTTFAEKQAALRTATSFRNDPSSVSLSDAKTAAGTANNFRERHGEQVKSGWQSANKLNSKYGIADKIGAAGAGAGAGAAGGARNIQPPPPMPSQAQAVGNLGAAGIAGKKKPPPPPPKKRAGLAGSPVAGSPQEGLPPPIPLSSKPKPPVSGHY